MAIVKQSSELRRMADLTVIHGAFHARLPGVVPEDSGLKEVAELCKRDHVARPARDWYLVRAQMLTVAADWDLLQDRLDRQSDECLHGLAEFLR
jgi:hypothetical protein